MDAPLLTPPAGDKGTRTSNSKSRHNLLWVRGFSFNSSSTQGLLAFLALVFTLGTTLLMTQSGLWSRDLANQSLAYSALMAPVASLAHFDFNHLLLNFTALGLLVWGFSALLSLRLLVISYVWLSAFVLVGVALFSDFAHYAGLSGVLHGWFALCAVSAIFQSKTRNIAVVLIAGALIKLLLESQTTLFTPSTDSGYAVAHIAHQFGFLGGVLAALFLNLRARLL